MLRYEEWDVADRVLRSDSRIKELQRLYDNKAFSRDVLRARRAEVELQILEDLLRSERISPGAFDYLSSHPKGRKQIKLLSRKHSGGPQVLRVTGTKSEPKTHSLESLRGHPRKVQGGIPGLGKRG